MDDPRPRVTVDKPVDLAALDAELGGVGLCAALDDDGNVLEVVATEGVTVKALQAAVEAHVAPDPPPTEAERLDFLQATVDALVLDMLMGGL